MFSFGSRLPFVLVRKYEWPDLSLTLAEEAEATLRQPSATASSLDGVREARISSAGPALAMAKAVVSPMDPGLTPVNRTVDFLTKKT